MEIITIQQQGKANSTFYVGGPVTIGASPIETYGENPIEMPLNSDSEPQSLLGTRFACKAMENAMPLIIDEVQLASLKNSSLVFSWRYCVPTVYEDL